MNRFRAVVADDEAAARRRIIQFLGELPDVELVGECEDGRHAVSMVKELLPDLLFLDVQMPKLSGFGVIREIGPNLVPAIIFVTAFDKFALQAFEANALDYLLKPFSRERFRQAVERARERVRSDFASRLTQQLQMLLKYVDIESTHVNRLEVKSGGGIIFLPVAEIDWIGAADNYLELHAGKEVHMIRETMNRIETKLDPSHFVRIHRSTIVNVKRVRGLKPLFNSDQLLTLRDGTQLTVSRNYRERLITALKVS